MERLIKLYKFFLIIDRRINGLLKPDPINPLKGNKDFTISQSWGRYIEIDPKKYFAFCIFCKILTYIDNTIRYLLKLPRLDDHCKDAVKDIL